MNAVKYRSENQTHKGDVWIFGDIIEKESLLFQFVGNIKFLF